MFQLDMQIASRGIKPKLWCLTMCQKINVPVYRVAIFCVCSTKLMVEGGQLGMVLYQALPKKMYLLQQS